MTKHATWAKVRHDSNFKLARYVYHVSAFNVISTQSHIVCLISYFFILHPFHQSGVKRAVKYVNEFLAPALCNQVNTVWNNRMTLLTELQHEEWETNIERH